MHPKSTSNPLPHHSTNRQQSKERGLPRSQRVWAEPPPPHTHTHNSASLRQTLYSVSLQCRPTRVSLGRSEKHSLMAWWYTDIFPHLITSLSLGIHSPPENQGCDFSWMRGFDHKIKRERKKEQQQRPSSFWINFDCLFLKAKFHCPF